LSDVSYYDYAAYAAGVNRDRTQDK
jgi:hypothetical protein